MKLTRLLMRAAALPLAWLLVGAAQVGQVIPHPDIEDEALLVPADSPVRFRGFDENGVAHFSGRFVLRGLFSYGCELDCEEPGNFHPQITIVPETALAARLPHWKKHSNDIKMYILRESRLASAIATAAERSALRKGTLSEIHGRVSVVVEDFQTSIECDSAGFSARFVALAQAERLAHVNLDGNYGCG